MRTRLALLTERLWRWRAARRGSLPRELSEPVVPTLRGWPVDPPQR
jgi:hypothetical protein